MTVVCTACTNLHHISTAKEFFYNLYENPFEPCTEKQLKNGSQPNCQLFWQILTLILPTVTPTSTVQDVYKQVHTVQRQAFIDTNKLSHLHPRFHGRQGEQNSS